MSALMYHMYMTAAYADVHASSDGKTHDSVLYVWAIFVGKGELLGTQFLFSFFLCCVLLSCFYFMCLFLCFSSPLVLCEQANNNKKRK
jgi:hypothetical protein